jgi:hypothetical protein
MVYGGHLIEEDPNTQLETLIKWFKKDPNRTVPIGIFKKNLTGGHAITAYAVEERGNGIYGLWFMTITTRMRNDILQSIPKRIPGLTPVRQWLECSKMSTMEKEIRILFSFLLLIPDWENSIAIFARLLHRRTREPTFPIRSRMYQSHG